MFVDIKTYVSLKKEEIKKEIKENNYNIKLLVILANQDEASKAYVKGKWKDCNEVGINFILEELDPNVSENELLDKIKLYNEKEGVNGILVQMPLPKHINEFKVKQAINPKKDVDGFNVLSNFKPCTPKGIIEYLKYNNYDFKSKNVVIVNRSYIVGRPLVNMLLDLDCNVTVLHSKTKEKDKQKYLESADLIISAIGKKYILNKYNFKKDAVLIDVGICRENNKLYGDFAPNLDVNYQSPVPGGVGLLTRLSLLQNLLEAYKNGI